MMSVMAEPGRGLHPRPQLTRERWFDLSGQWQFS
ncbi:MAG: hypothetical protein K0R30_2882, partial [Ornithinibacter sp.]|nr:hypothetical protein [Ornithinibacter sp.]